MSQQGSGGGGKPKKVTKPCTCYPVASGCGNFCASLVGEVNNTKTSVSNGNIPRALIIILIQQLDMVITADGIDLSAFYDVIQQLNDAGASDQALQISQSLTTNFLHLLDPSDANDALAQNLYLQASIYKAKQDLASAAQASTIANILQGRNNSPTAE